MKELVKTDALMTIRMEHKNLRDWSVHEVVLPLHTSMTLPVPATRRHYSRDNYSVGLFKDHFYVCVSGLP